MQSNLDRDSRPGESAENLYRTYEDYAKTVRTWLVAFGVGVPALILSNERLWGLLADHGMLRWVASLFLAGVGLQVSLAVLNKTISWINYEVELDRIPESQRTLMQKFSDWLSERYSVDLLTDTVTVSLFVIGTYLVFATVAATK